MVKSKFKNILYKANKRYIKYCSACDNICKEAQKYVDWANLRWEYLSGDGLCLGIIGEYYLNDEYYRVINDMTLVPVEIFFENVSEKGKVTDEDFYSSRI